MSDAAEPLSTQICNAVRFVVAVFLLVVSVPFFYIGLDIALNTDQEPKRALTPDEMNRVNVASRYIDQHVAETGELPGWEE